MSSLQRYLIVGGSVYLLELAVIYSAQHNGFSATVAVAISFWVGLIVSFILQKLLTFGDKRAQPKLLFTQILLFALLVLFNFGFTVMFTALATPSMPAAVARTIALLITTIWNYYLYKTKIFYQPIT